MNYDPIIYENIRLIRNRKIFTDISKEYKF